MTDDKNYSINEIGGKFHLIVSDPSYDILSKKKILQTSSNFKGGIYNSLLEAEKIGDLFESLLISETDTLEEAEQKIKDFDKLRFKQYTDSRSARTERLLLRQKALELLSRPEEVKETEDNSEIIDRIEVLEDTIVSTLRQLDIIKKKLKR
jgi:hypothetical protein